MIRVNQSISLFSLAAGGCAVRILMETQPFILANVGINVPLVVFREKCIF
jgi:hypothetical protein